MADRARPRQLMKSFMYVHPHRRGNRGPVMAVVLISLLLLMLALTLRSTIVIRAGTAASDNLIVFGTVYDSSGNPVELADVTVTVVGSAAAPQSVQSIEEGFYTVTFDMKDWQIGDTVKVVASFGGESGENQTTAGSAYPEIDVHLVPSIPIPEFHDSASVMLTIGAMASLVLLVARRRR